MKQRLTLCLGLMWVFLGFHIQETLAQSARANDAIQYVRENAEALGLTADDIRGVRISDSYTTRHNGITHVYLQQQYNDIDVAEAIMTINITSKGKVFGVGNRFVSKLASKVRGSAGLTAAGAAQAASQELGLTLASPLTVLSVEPITGTRLSNGGISLEPITAKLVYQPMEDGTVQLAWDVSIYTTDALHLWQSRINAATGVLLKKMDMVIHDTFTPMAETPFSMEQASLASASLALRRNPDSYNVFALPAESPNHPFPGGTPQSVVTNPAYAVASPFGWHDTNGAPGAEYTITRGNNVHAYIDSDNNNAPDTSPVAEPNGGASLDFNFVYNLTQEPRASNNQIRASNVNLFYWNNIIHDVKYVYGFNEAAGNFQVNNYGNGGAGNDDVRAEGQDGGGNCNANMSTLPDGNRPRMQMYMCNRANPTRDGDLDNGVIIHEYTHGTSSRLTGGPSTTACLRNTEQMGEGWSDWYSTIMTIQPGDTGPQARGMGTYLFGQSANGSGIRARPYSTDFSVNNFTYDNIKSASIPHGVGHVWATMLWDLTWALIGDPVQFPGIPTGNNGNGGGSGFNPNQYIAGGDASAGGNNLAMQLVTDGMKLQACSPGFVDGRNAIILADEAMTTGADGNPLTPDGQNACAIWTTFARRGLGLSANQGSSNNRSDGTQAFDLPEGACGGSPGPAFTITLLKRFFQRNGKKVAKIKWDPIEVNKGKIDIYVDEAPDGTYLRRTPNDGVDKVKLGNGRFPGNGPYTIQACEKNSTTVCSNVLSVDWTGALVDLDEEDTEETEETEEGGKGAAEVPEAFSLRGNYPNPFNPVTTIQFDLPVSAEVSVVVLDLLGRTVLEVPSQQVSAGFGRGIQVDASRLASGTYLYQVKARTAQGLDVITGRMVLVK